MESKDPQGSLGALGVGDGDTADDGELDGDDAGWASVKAVIATKPTPNAAAPSSTVRNIMATL